jgi:hypothetical protein
LAFFLHIQFCSVQMPVARAIEPVRASAVQIESSVTELPL